MSILRTTMDDLLRSALHDPHIHAMFAFHGQGLDMDQAMAMTLLAMSDALATAQRIATEALQGVGQQAEVSGG